MTQLLAITRVLGRSAPNSKWDDLAREIDAIPTIEGNLEKVEAIIKRLPKPPTKVASSKDTPNGIDHDVLRDALMPSSATCHGCWGSHLVEEPLYRLVGQHNGPTIKPIELRAGIIEGMLPNLARMVGKLTAEQTSRQDREV